MLRVDWIRSIFVCAALHDSSKESDLQILPETLLGHKDGKILVLGACNAFESSWLDDAAEQRYLKGIDEFVASQKD